MSKRQNKTEKTPTFECSHSQYHLRALVRPKSRHEYVQPKPRSTRCLEKESRKTMPRPRYAYVTLVMCGDEYSKGALALAWSLRQQKTKHELVVMATSDVSVRVLRLLCKLYDRVLKVGYVETKVSSTLRGKRYRDEDRWIKYSLTKARMLKLTEYDKIMWLDADTLVVQNIDTLFDLPTPAGICSSIRNHDYWHGLKLPELEIENSVENNYGVHGCIMVLEPNLDHYLLASSQPIIGDKKSFMGPDEFFFTQLYKDQWHHIHVRYGCTRWHVERLGIEPVVIHFVGAKPWEQTGNIQEWDGVWRWRATVEHMLHECRVLWGLFKGDRPKSAMPLLRLLTES